MYAVLIYGSLRYSAVRGTQLQATEDGRGFTWRVDIGEPLESPPGPYLVLYTPMDSEVQARQRIEAVAGFIATFEGRALVYERLFDTTLEGDSMTVYSPTLEDPGMHGRPEVSDEYLGFLSIGASTLSGLPDDERNRAELALRWVDAAVHDLGVDAFIKYWFAIETLAMPDGTDIRPVNEALAAIYGISVEAARNRFHVGRIYGRRSRIVHAGELHPIDARVLIYLLGLFSDLFRHVIAAPPAYRAARILELPDFQNFEALL